MTNFINTPAAKHHTAPDCAAHQWGCGCAEGECRSIRYDHILKEPKRFPLPEFLIFCLFWGGVAWLVL